jgi:nicotinate-nucleotide adenylyltransferase
MRIGIFGGTFDPPHLGHFILAEEAFDQLNLDRILWVLTPDPPHKQEQAITSLDERLMMVLAGIADNPSFVLSRVEIDRQGPHFALDTVRLLMEQYPGEELIYLIGGDSLHDLPTWHLPGGLIQTISGLGVMRRPGDQIDLSALEQKIPGLSDKIKWIDAPLLEISSSQIRQRIASGRPYRYFLLPVVYDLVLSLHLYESMGVDNAKP